MPSSTDKNGYISATCLGLTVEFFSGFSYPAQFLNSLCHFTQSPLFIFSPFLPHLFILLTLAPKICIVSKCLFCNFYVFYSLKLFFVLMSSFCSSFSNSCPVLKVFIYEIIVRDGDSFWPPHHFGSCHSHQGFCGASFGQTITPAADIIAC